MFKRFVAWLDTAATTTTTTTSQLAALLNFRRLWMEHIILNIMAKSITKNLEKKNLGSGQNYFEKSREWHTTLAPQLPQRKPHKGCPMALWGSQNRPLFRAAVYRPQR